MADSTQMLETLERHEAKNCTRVLHTYIYVYRRGPSDIGYRRSTTVAQEESMGKRLIRDKW